MESEPREKKDIFSKKKSMHDENEYQTGIQEEKGNRNTSKKSPHPTPPPHIYL